MDVLSQQMQVFSEPLFWGVSAWRLAAAVGLIFLGLLARKVLQGFFFVLARRARTTRFQWDDEATALLDKPLALLAQVFLWKAAVTVLLLPTEPVNVRQIVLQGLDVALAVGGVWVLFKVVDTLALVADRLADKTTTRLDDQAVPMLRKTLKIFVGLLGAVFVISNMGFSVTSLLASLGIGGLALALAAQDSVANFFGSLVLFTDAPFHVEDYVAVGDVVGTVEEIGFRTTRIRLDDDALVSVPNQTFTTSNITNFSKRTCREIDFSFHLPADTPLTRIQPALQDLRLLLDNHDALDTEYRYAHISEMNARGLIVEVHAYTLKPDFAHFWQLREDLILHTLRILEAHRIPVGTRPPTFVLSNGEADLDGHDDR